MLKIAVSTAHIGCDMYGLVRSHIDFSSIENEAGWKSTYQYAIIQVYLAV